ncbi:dTDP-glucose 4,6-dehydratase [Bacillus safensis]|nr:MULTISPECIES: dTDP-glucose 4,6-dehydratase [Bacillus]MDH6561671.1 dTDP-glucose 4,6-dehydratase [Bacillus sp. TBS-096]MEC0922707.1 dTDP-glucose 4,6-dehydratase [Bacillus safensis]MEC0995788.1 dTDP-glucose 4,6-dehydratase [Bacillus safensis]MEC1000610.1 dTDP-glucose 4,6-dehydratase [Bacillus safensis]MEC2425298.1 dTDP-glucose 4,6-dehydratase [Bacillus safensis]
MNLLITGGAGFIGSHFLKYMIEKYPFYNFVNLDKLTYSGNEKNLIKLDDLKNYSFIQGEITDRKIVTDIIRENKIQVIVNFAAETHVDRSIINSSPFIQTNIVGTHQLLEVCCKFHGIKFIQISTDEVYGSLSNGMFTEYSSLSPNNPYSSSKAGADLLVKSYYHTFGLDVNITRCTNNYGPNQYPEKLIPLSIKRILEGKKVELYGDGLNVRDWIYVEDHCSAIDKVLHQGVPGEIYNIGTNNEKSNMDIVKTILDILEEPIDKIEFIPDRLGHDRRYALDNSKIKHELQWSPSYSFYDSLKKTVMWYANNHN